METKTKPASVKAFGLTPTMLLLPACHPPPWIQKTTGRFFAPSGAYTSRTCRSCAVAYGRATVTFCANASEAHARTTRRRHVKCFIESNPTPVAGDVLITAPQDASSSRNRRATRNREVSPVVPRRKAYD